jgi:hypothetical protein
VSAYILIKRQNTTDFAIFSIWLTVPFVISSLYLRAGNMSKRGENISDTLLALAGRKSTPVVVTYAMKLIHSDEYFIVFDKANFIHRYCEVLSKGITGHRELEQRLK